MPMACVATSFVALADFSQRCNGSVEFGQPIGGPALIEQSFTYRPVLFRLEHGDLLVYVVAGSRVARGAGATGQRGFRGYPLSARAAPVSENVRAQFMTSYRAAGCRLDCKHVFGRYA